jgi:hypothetical protein
MEPPANYANRGKCWGKLALFEKGGFAGGF